MKLYHSDKWIPDKHVDINNSFPSSSESVKQRTNLFYLQPERCCVPNSPLWFSSTPLDDSTMEAMLIRILTVRELHLKTRKEEEVEKETTDDPSFVPDEEEDRDSEWEMTEVTFHWFVM